MTTTPDNGGLSGSLVHLQIPSLCKIRYAGDYRWTLTQRKRQLSSSDAKSQSTLSESRPTSFPREHPSVEPEVMVG